MPVVGNAFDRRVLAHRRHHDAIACGYRAECDRSKKLRTAHGSFRSEEIAHVALFAQPPHARDDFLHLRFRRRAVICRQPQRLVLQLRARQRVVRIAFSATRCAARGRGRRASSPSRAPSTVSDKPVDLRIEHHAHLVVECSQRACSRSGLSVKSARLARPLTARSAPARCPSRTSTGAPSADRSPARARRSRPGARAR